ncbi:MAG: DUF6502 family protein [Pseudomonadota bacterium]
MSKTNGDTGDAWFRGALRTLLRPLARALIRQGVTAPAAYRLLKEAYVEVAAEEFGLDGAPPTDSRISVLTGVYRREVKALRTASAGDDDGAKRKISVIALVIGRWLASPETTDADGAPAPLKRGGDQTPSFESLVASVSRDIRPRTVLDELVNQGIAAVSGEKDNEIVTLRADALLGPADLQQKLHFFAANIGDHIAAAADNLQGDDSKYLERAVFYNRLTPGSVDSLEATARRLANAALISLNRDAHSRQQADASSDESGERFRFGVYFYRVDETERAEQGDGAKGTTDGEPDQSDKT